MCIRDRAYRVVTSANIAAVEDISKENWHVTEKEIVTIMDISVGSAHHIVHDVLNFYKVSVRWVPCQVTAELQDRCVDSCEEHLCRLQVEGDGFLGRIVTGDKTWVHYH